MEGFDCRRELGAGYALGVSYLSHVPAGAGMVHLSTTRYI